MKVKKKVRMNLQELIKYARENEVEGDFKTLLGDWVRFYCDGSFEFLVLTEKDDIYMVNIEEELTEDNVIPNLLEVYESAGELDAVNWKYLSIREAFEQDDNKNLTRKAFYMINDDATMTLLWKEGELVE
ncbi:TPA: hypothetical protein R1915_002064 [Staphylococcus delphini]|nr:hypothetical protein [Staphylococcus pseudintermedius]HEC2173957.1 hypothetical protein [Staphylococcus delphini]